MSGDASGDLTSAIDIQVETGANAATQFHTRNNVFLQYHAVYLRFASIMNVWCIGLLVGWWPVLRAAGLPAPGWVLCWVLNFRHRNMASTCTQYRSGLGPIFRVSVSVRVCVCVFKN